MQSPDNGQPPPPPFQGTPPSYPTGIQGPPPGGPPPGYAPPPPGADKKLPAGLCGIFLGGFGVHKFILGYNTEGIIMLCASLFTCGAGYPIMHVIGIIEGIIYLTKSDQEFVQTYVENQKGWF